MILGIGCDIVKIERIERLIAEYGLTFKRRVFTALEISIGDNLKHHLQPSYYAKRFAAKEAFSKALGTGIGDYIGFLDIEITNNNLGAPIINCDLLKNKKSHLSISDERDFAIAYVIIENIEVYGKSHFIANTSVTKTA